MKLRKNVLVALFAGLIGFCGSALAAPQMVASPECDLAKLKISSLKTQLKFEADQAGLAASVKDPSQKADIMKLFKDYATENKCSLYILPAADLVAGILKDFQPANGASTSGAANSEMSNFQNKYLIVTQKKHECSQELGLKLPIKVVSPA